MDTENQASQLIGYLNRGGAFGYYWCKEPTGTKKTIWFNPSQFIPEIPEGSNDTYFGVNPSKTRKEGGRAKLQDLAAINCLFAEFDSKQFQGGKETALIHINQLIHPPSVLIDSGGGYHAYWLLVNPIPIKDQFTLDRLRDLQSRWVAYVGGDLDAKDLARVLRVPGTYNFKYDPPREVTVIFADYDMPYELADLTRVLPPPEPIIQTSSDCVGYNRAEGTGNWLKGALNRARNGNRNDTGFWLACQLRDAGFSREAAVSTPYPESVPQPSGDPYTRMEWEKTIASAYSQSPRQTPINRLGPVTNKQSNRLVGSQSMNGDNNQSDRPPVQLVFVTKSPGNNGHSVTGPAASTAAQSHVIDQASAIPGAPQETGTNEASTTNNSDTGHTGMRTWKLVYADFEKVRQSYDDQEAGDADLLADMYQGQICYDHAEGAWYIWRRHYWERDRTGFVYRLIARRVSPQYLHAAAEAQSRELEDLSRNLVKRAAALRNKKRMDNVLFLAARHEALALTGDEWDSNPWLLGCANGVIELKTGKHRPGKPKDYIRAHSEVKWTGLDANCHRWELFLKEIFQGDVSIANFIRRLFGYGITGLTVHHLFPILWGEGRNGKGTMLETLGNVLGSDLATSLQADALMDMTKSGEGPKPFIYNLRGKRLVWASESNEGRRINEGLVKQLTGGDRLNVRTLHSKPVEFFPSHLLMLMTNHKPHINADGSAIWRRVFLVPFEREFIDRPDTNNPKQSKADPYLIETLKSEQAGILAWLVRGCLEWQKDGLNPPEKILAATQSYREEEDTTGMWISDECLLKPDLETRGGILYKSYTEWCKRNGVMPMSITSFGKTMKRRYPARESHGIWYKGIGLLSVDGEQKIPF